MALFLSLVLGTLASEDLTCLAAALLIQHRQIGAGAAVSACTAGIVLGDVALWGVGRSVGRAALSWPWIAKRLPEKRFDECRTWLRRRAAGAIVVSRFLPGTRTALYLTAGMLDVPALRFAGWSLVAALLWTPAVVLSARRAGLTAIACGLAVVLGARLVMTPERRRRVLARVARWSRWEFWPMWIFYPPVAAWIAWLALRFGGLSTMTAANPGIADGGTVGESKHEILSKLPAEWTIPFVLVGAGIARDRIAAGSQAVRDRGWHYPVIVKPDVGERGAGVRLARSAADLAEYLAKETRAVLIQPYHPGPFEAGVFYYRLPHWSTGRILSITDKQFPAVVGDGCSTLEELIWRHPRYRMQAALFLRRHGEVRDTVVGKGERFQLAMAGNHAQGTVFREGRHLITPALERRIDDIARACDGFFVGRFDVRYGNAARFMAGDDLAIVELNGASAESTNIYDPDASLFAAYRQLFRQWSIVFAIGAANRAAGARTTPMRRLVALVRAHLHAAPAFVISD